MNLLFLVPSIGYGLMLFASSGNGMLLWLSLATLAVWLLHAQKKSFDLGAPVAFEGSRVWIGDRRLGLFPALWGTEIRNLVFSKAFESDPLEGKNDKELFFSCIGISSEGEQISSPLDSSAPHAILIGPTGAGKTELMKLIASQHHTEIWAIDFKGGNGFKDFPGLADLITNHDFDRIADWQVEFASRETRQLNPKLLIVVDELGEALKKLPVANFLEQVAAKGRSLNVMLLCANQTLSQIPRTIWVNCANRFSVRADLVDRSQLGFSGKPPELFSGMGVAELLTLGKQTAFRFPYGFQTKAREQPLALGGNPLLSRVLSRPVSEPCA